MATALGRMLPAGLTATVVGTELRVSLNSVTVGLTANPFGVRLLAHRRNVPGIGRARIEATGDHSGLTLFDVTSARRRSTRRPPRCARTFARG